MWAPQLPQHLLTTHCKLFTVQTANTANCAHCIYTVHTEIRTHYKLYTLPKIHPLHTSHCILHILYTAYIAHTVQKIHHGSTYCTQAHSADCLTSSGHVFSSLVYGGKGICTQDHLHPSKLSAMMKATLISPSQGVINHSFCKTELSQTRLRPC